ncbi:MAG: hypothetical protein F6K04_04975 [Leptolyngbya sp. SIO4C5]|uniref:photosystem II assembly protein Psb35 n=1 Tax=Sphaerothrix gracilis TaxID=3151835 RepID=UPI0013C01368|nr:hypothetical protein [Leptolyngbya sp. SIO4C5]
MNLFMQTAESTALPISLGMIFFIGFVAAVVLGSIAWYNSKRPAGWEDKERPDVVPKIDK